MIIPRRQPPYQQPPASLIQSTARAISIFLWTTWIVWREKIAFEYSGQGPWINWHKRVRLKHEEGNLLDVRFLHQKMEKINVLYLVPHVVALHRWSANECSLIHGRLPFVLLSLLSYKCKAIQCWKSVFVHIRVRRTQTGGGSLLQVLGGVTLEVNRSWPALKLCQGELGHVCVLYPTASIKLFINVKIRRYHVVPASWSVPV